MTSVEIRKSGIEGLVSGHSIIDEERTIESDDRLSEVMEKYLLALRDDPQWNKKFPQAETLLEPQEINAFLQSTLPYENHPYYPLATGFFVTDLIQKSHNAGFNDFTLHTEHLPHIDCLAFRLEGGLGLNIEGGAGDDCGSGAVGVNLSVNGNAGDRFGMSARDSFFQVRGDAGKDLGQFSCDSMFDIGGDAAHWMCYMAKRSVFTFRGDISGETGVYSKRCTFKTPNEETLGKMMRLVTLRNRLVYLHPDGSAQDIKGLKRYMKRLGGWARSFIT